MLLYEESKKILTPDMNKLFIENQLAEKQLARWNARFQRRFILITFNIQCSSKTNKHINFIMSKLKQM